VAKQITCDRCNGRGWTREITEWPDTCDLCGGEGSFSVYAVAHMLGVPESSLRRLLKGKSMKSDTAERILNAVLRAENI
jgi:hypothetical protein